MRRPKTEGAARRGLVRDPRSPIVNMTTLQSQSAHAKGYVLPHVALDEDRGWRRYSTDGTTLWFKGYEQTREGDTLARELAAMVGDEATICDWLAGLDGFFAIVFESTEWSLASVDRVRSIPLIWAERDGDVFVTQSGPWLEKTLGLGPADFDPDAATALPLAGFTIGTSTIYRDVHSLIPGQFLWARSGNVRVGTYHQWRPWQPEAAESTELVEPLMRLHERLIDKLIRNAQGRPILVPLSAGLDSRMVLSGLVEAGYANVRAFAYGLDGNREAVVSRTIARRLGVPWRFVPHTNRSIRRLTAGALYREFLSYSDCLTSIPFVQDLAALKVLQADGEIDRDTIVVNGQSGDFITGNHVLPPLTEPAKDVDPDARQARIVDALVAKHFKHWRALETPEYLMPVRRQLDAQIDAIGGLPENPAGDHGVFEFCEFIDRQSKYVVHGQRCYELLGLDWRLPLWDRDYLDFWEKAPLAAKREQNLYRTSLERLNWGSVWRNIPVNPLRIRPAWLAPIRTGLKIAHAPFGRACWHRFEKRYLDYWMSSLCGYAPWSYGTVVQDHRGHYSAMGWYIEAYLNRKGMAWNGRPLEADA